MAREKPRIPLTDAQQQIAATNYPGCVWLARKASRRYPHISDEEWLGAAHFALCYAAQTWEPSKGQFMNWLRAKMRGEISQVFNAHRPMGFKHWGCPRTPSVVSYAPDRLEIHVNDRYSATPPDLQA